MGKTLGIHILGRGFGESIVLQMPNGGVGVIDCFAPRLKAATSAERLEANPTLRFLKKLGPSSLAFVGFTHPHEDHGRGLSHLLEEFRGRIRELWVFRAYNFIHLERYMKALIHSGRKSAVEELLNEPAGTFSVELLRIRNLIGEMIEPDNRSPPEFRYFAGYSKFTLAGEPLVFHILGPTDLLEERYERALVDNMEGLVEDDGRTVNPDWEPEQVNHNQASAALMVEYGATRIVLGGDMEAPAWERVLAEMVDTSLERPPLTCQMVKVSHHGSATGYCTDLYERRFRRRRGGPLAVLTPFNRHSSPLPSPRGLAHLRSYAKEVVATNVAEACHASGLTLPGYALFPTSAESLSVPLGWASDLAAQPALLGALDPSVCQAAREVAPPAALPLAWHRDLHDNPRLVALLRAEFRHVLPSRRADHDGAVEEHSRVSVFFDRRGRELRKQRYVGRCAGPLP